MDWWEFLLILVVVMPIMVLWLSCLIDAIARPDLSGWMKAIWALGIIVFPLLGSIVYIVTRPPLVMAPNRNFVDQTWGVTPDSLPTSTARVDPVTKMPI